MPGATRPCIAEPLGSMDTFTLLKYLTQFVMPPASMAVGLLLAWVLALVGLNRLSAVVAILAIAQTLIMSFPPVADALLEPLQDKARAAAAEAPACCYDAIVVLGGGVTPAAPPYLVDPDLVDAADRVWHAARLYHRGLARRIIVSGGSLLARNGDPATTEAEAMRRFLVDLGVPSEAIVSESKSQNTLENIRNVRQMVGEARVALVTSASHMPRALKLARQANLNVGAFPTDWRLPAEARPSWENWVPSIAALAWSSIGLREHVALLLDRRGEI
ncbi:MAG: YdcF family protein [Rhodospirillales bacterium]|nr:YdcF family protein [Rhodospirillales bacterium]